MPRVSLLNLQSTPQVIYILLNFLFVLMLKMASPSATSLIYVLDFGF
jgi:hypothetical protein